MSASGSVDVAVVGGGVIGLSVAYFLAREGVPVALLDRGDFGQEASWAGAGILPPGNPEAARTPFDRLRTLSGQLLVALSAELRERTGIDNEYVRCGGLELHAPPHDPAAEQEWHGDGVTVETLGERAARRLEPELAAGVGPALHLPDLAQLRNPRHLKALVAGCAAVGVRLRPHTPVHTLERYGDRVAGLHLGDERLRAEHYVLAGGAWTDGLLAALGWRLGIRPVRGQIALLTPDRPLLRRVVMSGPRYLVPRQDGRVLVGSTEEDAGFDKRTTAEAIRDLLALAVGLIPALGDAALEHCWAGLRPASPDGLPFLGRVPGVENVYVAAGHFRAGIGLSAGTALLMKELLLGQPRTLPLEPFRLDRRGRDANSH